MSAIIIDEVVKNDNRNNSLIENYKPRLDHRSPYRNLYLAVMSNAFNQLFESILISVKTTIYDINKLKSEEKPTSLPLAWDIKVMNDMEYNMAYSWFDSDEKDNIFDFLTCCDFLNMNFLKIRDRVFFIDNCRTEIIEKISSNRDDLKNIIRKKYNIYEELKSKYKSHPKKTEFEISEIIKKNIDSYISEKYKIEFGTNPIRKEI